MVIILTFSCHYITEILLKVALTPLPPFAPPPPPPLNFTKGDNPLRLSIKSIQDYSIEFLHTCTLSLNMLYV